MIRSTDNNGMKSSLIFLFLIFTFFSCKSEIVVNVSKKVNDKKSEPENDIQIIKTLSIGSGNLITKNSLHFTYKNTFHISLANIVLEDNQTANNFSASGLPEGMSINNSTGVISGIPNETGVFNIQVEARRSNVIYRGSLSFTVLRELEFQKV